MKIKLLPFDQFSLKLPVSSQTALNTVDKHTQESSLGKSFNPLLKAFGGSVNETGFKLRRFVEYQNSFSPVVIGTISEDNEHCTMDIKMRMHYFVMAFMVVWLIAALSIAFGAFSFAISGYNALITFFLGYGLMIYSFWKEAGKAKEELNIIFSELF